MRAFKKKTKLIIANDACDKTIYAADNLLSHMPCQTVNIEYLVFNDKENIATVDQQLLLQICDS